MVDWKLHLLLRSISHAGVRSGPIRLADNARSLLGRIHPAWDKFCNVYKKVQTVNNNMMITLTWQKTRGKRFYDLSMIRPLRGLSNFTTNRVPSCQGRQPAISLRKQIIKFLSSADEQSFIKQYSHLLLMQL